MSEYRASSAGRATTVGERLALAQHLYETGAFEDALVVLGGLQRDSVDDPRIDYAIAASYFQLGDDEAAGDVYLMILDRDPDSAEARRMLRQIRQRRTESQRPQRDAGYDAASAGHLLAPEILTGPVICGVVEEVRGPGSEASGFGAGHLPTIQTEQILVLTIRFQSVDGAFHTAVMRGVGFSGSLPTKGRPIAVPAGRRVEGRLEVDRIENLDSHDVLRARQPSRSFGILYFVFGAFVILFLIFIFTVVISGMLGHPVL